MDASRFDSWTRAIGARSGRRALLGGIAGTAVAFGAVGLVADRTDAKKKKKKKCDKQQKQKCAKRGRTCLDGKCVFGDCGECTTNAQCDAKYPDEAGDLECVLYHGPICASVQCAKGVARCAQRCGTQN